MSLLADVVAWLTDPAHWQGSDGIPVRLYEHLAISSIALGVALAAALPIGLITGHRQRGGVLAINAANFGRAIPSYAVLVMVLPISLRINTEYGLDVIPTFVSMTLLAIPPILVNAYAGIREVDRELVEAARAMGMREGQILRRVELPVAIAPVMSGLRTAAVQVIATATLGAVVAYGGLGRYIIDGFARNQMDRMSAGVVLVAALALLTEGGLSVVQRLLTPAGLRLGRSQG